MKKIEIYLDNIEKLVIREFKDIDNQYESEIIKGTPVYEYIRKLSKSGIINIYEAENGKDIVLECKNQIINLSNYERMLKKVE